MKLFERMLRPIDNAPLVVFRMFFGFLLFAETLGAIFTGWVRTNFIRPAFTFSHIGLEWLQPLPGQGMYFYFVAMSILGLMVMLGYKYRWALAAFTILWAGVYFMQKESYNNHYYLLLLVCLIMLFLPANAYASIDARQDASLRRLSMPQWCSWVMILQISIVYVFATVSKLYPGWIDGKFIGILLRNRSDMPLIGPLFEKHWFHLFIAWSGMLFDFLIVPLLLYKRTRTVAFICSLIFHIFNSIVLQIGIFPFFALSFIVFFYPAEMIRRIFLRKKPLPLEGERIGGRSSMLAYFFIPYFIIQLVFPLRHFLIKGDVLWTEEGHRLSWRMMLRQRSGIADYTVVDKKTGETSHYSLMRLTQKQRDFVTSKPDGIWQMSQRIKQEYADAGKDISIFVQCRAAVNNSPFRLLINPTVDMASAKWNYFGHADWILIYDDKGNLIK